ncbi:peptidylprolyl isomerase [Basilea psittacipulmonis]|uniref:Peptidyl-prolyl cis-trans isomerase n=1 Tax=Basilea psittacipulmonis DSM 24701 TaxID=1072685 RepID=A0A077DFU0_9BURK|nr:peptidylprolyl isomerase [Basilea psittacipulmonis]AIL32038.1 hypothetical protein IX83_00685 [Basilea psittacipulmonis DSM 24701]
MRKLLASVLISTSLFSPLAHAAIPATIHTNMGDIHISLFDKKAPVTVENFIRYAKEGFYDNTLFHRVIPDFVIQGGGMTQSDANEELQPKNPTHPPIINESKDGTPNLKYTIAMARFEDPDSARAQFFINVANNDMLNYKNNNRDFGYTVFAKVQEDSHDVVDKIEKVKTRTLGPFSNVPVTPVVITGVTIGN